jgi:hypothetical protein
MADAQALYTQALAAIEAGNTKQAIQLLQQSLEQDSYNLDGWIKLAEIMPDNDIKYEVLEQILQIDPNNEFANSEWDRLNEATESGGFGAEKAAAPLAAADTDFLDEVRGENQEGKRQKTSRQPTAKSSSNLSKLADMKSIGPIQLDDELVPGITNREAGIVGGSLLLFTLLMCFITYSVISGANRQDANIIARETARVFGLTQTLDANATNIVSTFAAETQVAADLTATMAALVSPTPTLSGGLVRATEILPTPTLEPTVFTSRVFSAPPASIPGNILVWGGQNPASSRYLFLYRMNAGSDERIALNNEMVESPSVDTIGSRLVYMRYHSELTTTVMDMVPANDAARFPDILDLKFGSVINLSQPSLAASGNYLVFIGTSQDTGGSEVFLWDFLNEVLLRLTTDGSYVSAAVNSTGTKIVAVREEPSGSDLILLDRESATEGSSALQIRLTDNRGSVTESHVEFATDGSRILYTVTANNNSDIMSMDMTTFADTPLVNTPANEMYPHFSPDNRFVVYSANPTGAYNVYILDTISGQTYQLTESTREAYYAAGWYN